jgi:hypothetical protein
MLGEYKQTYIHTHTTRPNISIPTRAFLDLRHTLGSCVPCPSLAHSLSPAALSHTLIHPYNLFHTPNKQVFPKAAGAAIAHAQANPGGSYIVKPLSMGGGLGISVVDGDKGLHKIRHKTHIVQAYLPDPYLINQRKWDMRTYVLVTSTFPMRAYLFNRGLIRFASTAYDPDAKKGGKKSQFLTNTSVNKHYVKKGM